MYVGMVPNPMILTNSCLQITAIKDAWKTTDVMEEINAISKTQSSHKFRPSLINGLSQPPNFEEILSSLPSKPAADKLVHHFFECYSPAIPARSKRSSVLPFDMHRLLTCVLAAFHKPTFLKEVS
jgi:hypothetical protein